MTFASLIHNPPHFQVFTSDILRLLSMEDMWRNRTKPTALEFDKIREGTFALPMPAQSQGQAPGTAQPNGNGSVSKLSNGVNAAAATANGFANGSARGTTASQLKDQRELSLLDNLELFVSRYAYLLTS